MYIHVYTCGTAFDFEDIVLCLQNQTSLLPSMCKFVTVMIAILCMCSKAVAERPFMKVVDLCKFKHHSTL